MRGDPSDIRNWQRRPDGITTSGRLKAPDPERLAALGVRHVINLAMDDHPEALPHEGQLMAEQGIAYTHIPVPFDCPTLEHVMAMREAIEDANGPLHVHCIMNYRVTAFFYILDCARGEHEPVARARMAEVWNPLTSDDPRAAPWRDLLSRS